MKSTMNVFFLLALSATSVTSFGVVSNHPHHDQLVMKSSTMLSMAPPPKGFDSNAKPQKKEKSEGQVKREAESAKYDEVASTGGQEYSIFVRQFGGEDGSWLPCGSVAVPRTTQVADAIFGNEAALIANIVRTFPKLKGYETEFEYGYNLKIYPDDPVEIAKKGKGPESGMTIGNWISTLLSPIDTSQVNK